MTHALAGKVIEVHLTDGSVVQRPLTAMDEQEILKYLGGRGYNARLLWERVPAKVDPLGPENILIFGTGTQRHLHGAGYRFIP